MQTSQATFVLTPRIGNWRSAADALAIAASRVAPSAISLASIGSYWTGDLGAFLDAAVDAYAGTGRLTIQTKRAGLRKKSIRRIFRVHPALDGMTALSEGLLTPGQGLAGCDLQLRADEIGAGDGLGHAVLDLEARVHLEEVEPRSVAVALEQEFDRSGVPVADLARRGYGGLADLLAQPPA